MLLREFLQRGAADFVGHVTNTLQLGDGFDDGHHQTQIARRRLTFRDNAHARFVDGDFHHVDVLVAFNDALRQLAVLVVHRRNRIGKLLFNHATHGHHLRANTLQLCVELAGNVFVKIEVVHDSLQINRSGQ
ncbi:Uncharacterised protein [Enterobacter kobei]|nr:hypothetical protein AC520_1857 [Enterobacter sp. OLF]CZX27487.1 Uncharacterised protein [Enterobacter kobei]